MISGDKDGKPQSPGRSAGFEICFIPIPLITIVATFVFELFLPVIMFIFQLWWMLALKFCIPPEIDVAGGISAEIGLDGKIGISADLNIDASIEASIQGGVDLSINGPDIVGGVDVSIRPRLLGPRLTISIGVASAEDLSGPETALFALADKLLYAAKNAGRNQYAIGELENRRAAARARAA